MDNFIVYRYVLANESSLAVLTSSFDDIGCLDNV